MVFCSCTYYPAPVCALDYQRLSDETSEVFGDSGRFRGLSGSFRHSPTVVSVASERRPEALLWRGSDEITTSNRVRAFCRFPARLGGTGRESPPAPQPATAWGPARAGGRSVSQRLRRARLALLVPSKFRPSAAVLRGLRTGHSLRGHSQPEEQGAWLRHPSGLGNGPGLRRRSHDHEFDRGPS